MEKRSEGCSFCNVPLFIEVQQAAQPILAPLTPAAAAWDEYVSKSGRNYVQLTNRFCPMCGREIGCDTNTAKERRDALTLAYQVLTDDRNLKKYSMCGIRDTKTMDLFEYGDMLRVLRTMHKEAADLAKEVT